MSIWEVPEEEINPILPTIPEEEIYEDEDDGDWEDSQCYECGQIGDECVCEWEDS